MGEMLSANDQQSLVSSFLERAVGQTADTARQFLQATSWKLEEALQLFHVGNEGGQVALASQSPPAENANPWPDVNSVVKDNENENVNVGQDGGEEVRPPLLVVRDTLYDDAMFYSDDLVSVLKEKRDMNILMQCVDQFKALQSSCDAEFNDGQSLLKDYQKKIDECRQKTEKAKLEVPSDMELDLLQKEMEKEREEEHLLMEELRVINNEINDLERQRIFIEEQKQTLKKHEQEELRAQRKLSMYASVTTIIPNLDDHSKISGNIVDRAKKKVEKFEFDPTKMTAFDTCQNIWKMIAQ